MPNKSSIKSKKIRKFRIVLDSAFAKTSFFPKLNKRAKVFHCVHDFGLSKQASDNYIYQKAYENSCFVLTVNFVDFKKLIKGKGPGVLGIESQLTTEKMDRKVADFVAGKNPGIKKGFIAQKDKRRTTKMPEYFFRNTMITTIIQRISSY